MGLPGDHTGQDSLDRGPRANMSVGKQAARDQDSGGLRQQTRGGGELAGKGLGQRSGMMECLVL